MPRPPCCRRVSGRPAASIFKPQGIPTLDLPETVMTLDELEAIRLADLQGLYHQEAAERMEVSRATFGRILESARRKVAEAIIRGGALRIEGGLVRKGPACNRPCPRCRREEGVS